MDWLLAMVPMALGIALIVRVVIDERRQDALMRERHKRIEALRRLSGS